MTAAAVQMYETVVQSNNTNTAFFFCTVPSRSLPTSTDVLDGSQGTKTLSVPDYLLEQLDLRPMFELRPDQLEGAIAALVSDDPALYRPIYDTSFLAEKDFHLRRLTGLPVSVQFAKSKSDFVAYLLRKPIVPFENSPLSADSLFDIVTKATGTGIGAYIGFVVAGNSPLLLVSVPAGMVICGAASGLAKGLEEGLRARVRALISKR
jgi:hypothetical protein